MMYTTAIAPTRTPGLSGNMLKIIAAVSMLADHIGFILFPRVRLLRYIGRIAFPIFAFMIGEGCVHTRSKLRYYGNVLLLGVLCQVAYTVAMEDLFLCAPVSLSLAIPLVYLLQSTGKALRQGSLGKGLCLAGLCLCAIGGLWWVLQRVRLDYGFWGCMLPVAASLPGLLGKWDRHGVRVMSMGLCMIPLALEMGAWQWWSLLALPVLGLYSGKRGSRKMKGFFYVFYPAHLVLLEGVYRLLHWM